MTETYTRETMERVAHIVEREAGIVVPDNPKFVINRLARVDRAILDRALRDDPASIASMVAQFCTHETRFFREPAHFEFLTHQFAPRVHDAVARGTRNKVVRAWSAASSTGEEPYSLAMTLCDAFPAAAGWSVEVLGTDVSEHALERARSGRYAIKAASLIGNERLRRYMLQGSGPAEGAMSVNAALAATTRFERLNLVRPPFAVQGRFDIIFCRNVLFYFRPEKQRAVVEALSAHLSPEGVLFTGHAESSAARTPYLEAVAPSTFKLKQAA